MREVGGVEPVDDHAEVMLIPWGPVSPSLSALSSTTASRNLPKPTTSRTDVTGRTAMRRSASPSTGLIETETHAAKAFVQRHELPLLGLSSESQQIVGCVVA